MYDQRVPATSPELIGLDPLRVIPGGRLWLRGTNLPVPTVQEEWCAIGGLTARVVFASPDRLAVEVPAGLDGGRNEVKVPWLPGATLFVEVGTIVATGLHQVDSPAVDAGGRVYVTYSGTRGQQSPVSVFRISEPGGPREPLVSGIVNATSLAFGPDGLLYVSSRFDGAVYRVFDDGRYERFASDLGLACGLAFAPDGTLLVGDRSGTIFRVDPAGHVSVLATLPPSVAAFHLAMSPDGSLFVAGPTLGTYDRIYRVTLEGRSEPVYSPFGRPQGLACDADGVLHVVEALAGSSAVHAIRAEGAVVFASGPRLVGLAFGPRRTSYLATSDTVYAFGG